ncbi:MAG: CvpA family protein [Pseudomonadota bacterium]
MTRFDLFVLAVMAFSAFVGWHRGGIREIVTLLAIAAGFAAIGAAGAKLSGAVDGTFFRLAVLVVLFLAGYVVVSLAGAYAVRAVLGSEKKRGDRFAGGVFGLLRGWLLGAFALYTVTVYHTETALPAAISESLFAPALEETVAAFLRNADLRVTGLSNPLPRAISPSPA